MGNNECVYWLASHDPRRGIAAVHFGLIVGDPFIGLRVRPSRQTNLSLAGHLNNVAVHEPAAVLQASAERIEAQS